MKRLVANPVYEFNPNQLQEVRALNGYKDEKQIKEALDALKDWIEKQNHFSVKEFDPDYLERMIICNKGSVELAKERLDRTCTLRTLMPEFMCNIDVKNEFQDFRKCLNICVFPKPTKDNYRIFFVGCIKTDDSLDVMKYFRYMVMMNQYSLFHDYCAGVELVLDYSEITFSMISSLNLIQTQKGLVMLMKTFGNRVKLIHIVVRSKVIDNFITFLKKCLSEKLSQRVLVHSSYDSLCKTIDKSLLPVKLGGEYTKSIAELSDEFFKELCSDENLNNMKNLDKAVTIESLRLGSSFNEEYSGMPGMSRQYSHGLKYNCTKSKVMVRSRGMSLNYLPPIRLCGEELHKVERFKYLGHIMTCDLKDDFDIERERRALAVRGNMLALRFVHCTVEMDQISIFPYSAEERLMVLKELGFTESSIKEDVDAIMDWFQMQPHLVDAGIDSEVIVKILIMAKGSREKTKSKIYKFYKYRGLSPDLIHSRIEVLTGCQDIWTFYRQGISTKLYDGKRITTLQFVDPNPSTFRIEELFRNSYMIGDLRLKYDYMLGEIWLLDLKNITLGHFLRINPMVVQRASQMFQEGSGFRVFSIHVLNVPSIGRQIYSFFKQFIKTKLLDRLMVHETLEDLHKVLPKMYLPKDYGGDDYSMDEFKDLYQKEYRSEKTLLYLLEGCNKVSDESKRPDANKDEELVGTFKKLDLD